MADITPDKTSGTSVCGIVIALGPRFRAAMAVLLCSTSTVQSTGSAQSTCREASLLSPTSGQTIDVARAALQWAAVPELRGYRVEVESRIPEGRVIHSLDSQVFGIFLRTPQALTDSRAVIKVRVTAGCPADDGSQLRSQTASFFIDTTPLCPAPARIDIRENAQSIDWEPTPNATRYDVALLRPDGTQIAKRETQQSDLDLPPGNDPLVAVIRPYCATGFGPYATALIPAAQD